MDSMVPDHLRCTTCHRHHFRSHPIKACSSLVLIHILTMLCTHTISNSSISCPRNTIRTTTCINHPHKCRVTKAPGRSNKAMVDMQYSLSRSKIHIPKRLALTELAQLFRLLQNCLHRNSQRMRWDC